MTEIGSLPEEWKIVRLGDVFEFSRKPRSLEISEDERIPFIPMDHISDSTKHANWLEKRLSEIPSGTFVFKNDLIVAKITPSFENGKQAILSNLPKDFAYATTEVWALHPNDESALTDYLYMYLRLPAIRKSLANKMEGSTGRQRLPRYVLENLEFPLPPLLEQKKIATVLSAVQEAKEKTEDVTNGEKDLKRSLMKHVFTYGPVPVEEAENVPLDETEIGAIPQGWEIVTLKDVSRSYKNGIYKKREFYGSGFPCVRMYNIVDGKVNTKDAPLLEVSRSEFDRFELREGDLLINRVNSADLVGKAGVVPHGLGPATFESKNIRVRLDMSRILPVFVSQHVQTSDYLNRVRMMIRAAVSQVTINQDDLDRILLPLPSIREQKLIVNILTTVDQKIEADESKEKALHDLFKTLLHNLMTAKIRVNDLETET